MKKTIHMISALVVVFLIIISTVRGSIAANQEGINFSLDDKVEQSIAANQEGINFSLDDKVEQSIAEQERLKEEKYGKREELIKEPTFYEQCYAKATESQKKELDIIIDNNKDPSAQLKRPIMLVLGELPQNTPRLTLEEAKEIYGNIKESGLSLDLYESELVKKFNEIAGAPDYIGGSGIRKTVYFINDEKTESIVVLFYSAVHFLYDEKGIETLMLPLGE